MTSSTETFPNHKQHGLVQTALVILAYHHSIAKMQLMYFILISKKNIPTPKLTVGKQFYMRLLWTYLFGIFNASTNTMCALMWNELIAHRGANDVVSSLAHFIFNTRSGRTGAKHSIWWADNCPGQNKNHCVVWFFQDLVRQQVYSRIDYKFLVVGHTYGPTDRFFGVIENHLKKIENVYTPQEWYCHVQSSSTSIEVIEMKQEFFCDYWSHLRLLYTEHKDVHGKPVDFSKAIWFNFGEGDELLPLKGLVKKKHPDEVWVRYSYDPHEMPQKVCYMKNNFDYVQHSPDRLYKSAPIPIKKAKAADLKRLANDYVPRDVRNMYLNLPTTAD